MDKIKFLNHKLLAKTNIAILCSLVMIWGLLHSRSVLSLGMMVMGGYCLLGVHPKRWFRSKWWLLGLAWIGMYVLSYFWSDDVNYWNERFQVKLPVLLLPLAFAFLPKFSTRQLMVFWVGAAAMFLWGAWYSISFLIKDYNLYYYGYNYSHVLPVPMNDHIRFSLAIALFIIWSIYMWPHFKNKLLRVIVAMVIVVLTAFLHILAARTGLLALYIFLLGWAIYAGMKRNKVVGITAVVSLAVFLLLVGNYVPTLKQRIGYFKYTIMEYKKGKRDGIYSDMGRLMSYKISTHAIAQHPLTGVGAGDMQTAMAEGYKLHYPNQEDRRILAPHNQFLCVALACGIPAMLLFALWVLAPLRLVKRSREGFFFFIVWLIGVFHLMIEPVLEVQMGVFVYLFFLLWQRHTFLYEKDEPAQAA